MVERKGEYTNAMKKVSRPLVFETNSSSTCSVSITNNIIMCTQDDLNKWQIGELLYDTKNNSLITSKNIREEYQDKAIETYQEACKKDKYRTPWDKLEVSLQNEWVDQYIKSNCNNYLRYKELNTWYSQVDVSKFVASNGEIIVAVCVCDYETYDEYD